MIKIDLEKNESGMQVYINGVPNVDEIEQAEKELFINSMVLSVMELYKKKRSKKEKN
ncbi:MAG: hypothetical protein SO434_03325 [Eubacteriales bacterium]|nr:hypothetical protein [Eubacteriales bacterium]